MSAMNSLFEELWSPYLIIFITIPDIANLLFLTIGLFVMYNGIEIRHPIYAVLFVNILVAALSALINIVCINLVDKSIFLVIANASNTWYMLFHCTTWSVTSVLRYLYILHDRWIDKTFPDQRRLTSVSILAVFLIFFAVLTPFICIILSLGKQLKVINLNFITLKPYLQIISKCQLKHLIWNIFSILKVK